MIESLHHVRVLEAEAVRLTRELAAAREGLTRAEAELAAALAEGESGQAERRAISKGRGAVADLESDLRAHGEAARLARSAAEPEARAEVAAALEGLHAAQDVEAVAIERALAEMHTAAQRLHALHAEAEGRVREFAAAYPNRSARLPEPTTPRSFRAAAAARLAAEHRLVLDVLKEASNGH